MFKIHIIITRLKIEKKINEHNTELHHCRIREWISTMGDKQAFYNFIGTMRYALPEDIDTLIIMIFIRFEKNVYTKHIQLII